MKTSPENYETQLRPLRAAGLVVEYIVPWDRDTFSVYRPRTVKGNHRPDYQRFFRESPEPHSRIVDHIDAPKGYLRWNAEGWSFRIWEWIPGPGPGEFERIYPTLEAAVQAVLEYYFGDPAWMNTEEAEGVCRTSSCT